MKIKYVDGVYIPMTPEEETAFVAESASTTATPTTEEVIADIVSALAEKGILP